MSKLAKDQAAFKSALHRQDYTSWHSQPPPLASRTTSPSSQSSVAGTPKASSGAGGDDDDYLPVNKKKKAKSNIVYSQPADTGTGHNVNTQLVYAVNHLKVSTGLPRSLR
jgi:transcription initiation factor TFIIE subunit beta